MKIEKSINLEPCCGDGFVYLIGSYLYSCSRTIAYGVSVIVGDNDEDCRIPISEVKKNLNGNYYDIPAMIRPEYKNEKIPEDTLNLIKSVFGLIMHTITFKSNVLAKIDGGEKRGKTRLFVEGQTIEVSEVYSVDEEIVFEVQVGSSAVTYYGVPLVLVDTDCEEVENKR